MAFIFLLAVVFSCITAGIRAQNDFIPEELVGSTVVFSSLVDQSVITVKPDGKVITEVFRHAPEQEWTLALHPRDPELFLEFQQAEVPYNELSGYEDPPNNPGLYPRPLGLIDRGEVNGVQTWNIVVRGRWCLQNQGIGNSLDRDDCESYRAPYQLWTIQEAS